MTLYSLAILGGIYTCSVQYERYVARPTVVSLERDAHDWNGTLPGVTFCYQDNLSSEIAQEFILDKWNVTPNDERFEYYSEFLNVLHKTTINSLGDLAAYYEDGDLNFLDFLAVIHHLLVDFDHYLSGFDRSHPLIGRPIITERGICYSANSVKSGLISLDPKDRNNVTEPLLCNYQNQCVIKVDFYGFNISIAVHSPFELVTHESFFYDLGHIEEITATYKLLQTVNEDSVRDLSLQQRKCLFNDEAVEGLPSYSVNLCLMKCRVDVAVSLCGCKPFFYPFLGKGIELY